MKNHNYSESDIQKYILGALTEDEIIKFKIVMDNNPEFAKTVSRQIKIAEGIEYFGAQKFKSRVKNIYAEVRPEINLNDKPQTTFQKWIKIILLSIVILGSLFFVYQYFGQPQVQSPENIYAKYFQKYDWNPNLRSDIVQNIEIDQAEALYSSRDYAQAIPILEMIIEANPNKVSARLALASSHLENETPQLAIPHLEYILGLDDVLFKDQANWYLGLAYLKMGNLDNVKEIFSSLALDEDADYNQEAKTILQFLE